MAIGGNGTRVESAPIRACIVVPSESWARWRLECVSDEGASAARDCGGASGGGGPRYTEGARCGLNGCEVTGARPSRHSVEVDVGIVSERRMPLFCATKAQVLPTRDERQVNRNRFSVHELCARDS